MQNLDEDTISNYLQNEINSALSKGAFIAMIFGFMSGIVMIISSLVYSWINLWIPSLFPLTGGFLAIFLFQLSRKGRITKKLQYFIILLAAFFPTLIFIYGYFTMENFMSIYLISPVAYVYFITIIMSGFMFDSKLSYFAGILSATGYFISYLLMRDKMLHLTMPDSYFLKYATSPFVHGIRSFFMIIAGLLIGSLASICRRLIFRVLKYMDEWHHTVE